MKFINLLLIVISFSILAMSSNGFSVDSNTDKTRTPEELQKYFDIKYLGAFRANAEGDSDSNYAVGTLGINTEKKSLFLAGHAHHNAVAEFKIPNVFSKKKNVADIIEAEVLQNYVKVLDKKQRGNDTNRITGMLYVDGNLIINSEIWYDGAARNKDNIQVFEDASNLRDSKYKGLFQLEGGAMAAGYMSSIPKDLQDSFGGEYLTGWASNYGITGRYSQGPSLYIFDPKQVISSQIDDDSIISTDVKMAFPMSLGQTMVVDGDKYDVKISPIWGPMATAKYGFIVPGSNKFMVLGRHAGINGGIGYKITQDNGVKCHGACSTKAADIYNYYWLFDINEILNASQSHLPRPSSYGKWRLPFDNNGSNSIAGAAYDQASQILYISLENAGRVGLYDRPPLILAYKLRVKPV